MIEKTCKTCSQTFKAKHKNATYCSDLCRPTASKKLKEKAEMKERKRIEAYEAKRLEEEVAFQMKAAPGRWNEYELRQLLRNVL